VEMFQTVTKAFFHVLEAQVGMLCTVVVTKKYSSKSFSKRMIFSLTLSLPGRFTC